MYFLLVLALWNGLACARVRTTVADGAWSTISNWDANEVPIAGEIAVIMHTLTMATPGEVAEVIIDGTGELVLDAPAADLLLFGTSAGCFDVNCAQCLASASVCEECAEDFILSVEGVCVAECPVGEEGVVNTDVSCTACPANCDTCFLGVCSSCADGHILGASLEGIPGACAEACPEGQYGVVDTDVVCTACSASIPFCEVCAHALECHRCGGERFLLVDKTGCGACSVGEWARPDYVCDVCADPFCALCPVGNCTVCDSTHILSLAGDCVDECPDGEEGVVGTDTRCTLVKPDATPDGIVTVEEGAGEKADSPLIYIIIAASAVCCLLVVLVVALAITKSSNKKSTMRNKYANNDEEATVVHAKGENVSAFLQAMVATSEPIAQGGFGSVYKVRTPNGDEIALKVLETQQTEAVAAFHREVNIHLRLAGLSAGYVVDVAVSTNDPGFTALGLTYAAGGSVHNLLRTPAVAKSFDEQARVALRCCQILDYIHASDVYHGDVKPQNFLVMGDGQILMCDFGLSFVKSDMEMIDVSALVNGTPQYMAPERYAVAQCDDASAFTFAKSLDLEKVDVYSFGIMMWSITHPGEKVYKTQATEVLKAVAVDKARPVFTESVPKWYAELAERCWAQGAEGRPGFAEVIDIFNENWEDQSGRTMIQSSTKSDCASLSSKHPSMFASHGNTPSLLSAQSTGMSNDALISQPPPTDDGLLQLSGSDE